MTTRRHRRTLAAVASASCLLLGACGTRLNHDTIVGAAAGSSTQAVTDGISAPGQTTSPSGLGTLASPGTDSRVPADSGAQPGETAGAATAASGRPDARHGDQAGGGGPIVIGSVGWYSGPGGAASAQMPRALQAWAAATNAKGGLNGRQVKVIVYDDGGDTSKSMSLLRKLVEEDKAVAVVASGPSSGAIKSWTSYLEAKRIPAVGSNCFQGWNDSGMMFSECPSMDTAIKTTAVLAARLGKGKKLGGLFCTEDAVCSRSQQLLFADGYAKRAGLDPRYEAKISITQPDFTAECLQARNAGVDLMFVGADPNTVGRVAASCQRQNFHPQFLQMGTTIVGDSVTKPGLTDLLASVFTFPFAGLDTPAFHEFTAAWQKYGGGQEPGPAASEGWAASKIFEKVALAAGNALSRSTLIEQLYRIRNDRFGGLTVPLTFTPKGTSDLNCLFVMRGQGGKWTAPHGDEPVCA